TTTWASAAARRSGPRTLADGDRRVGDDRGVPLLRLGLDQDLLALAPPGDLVGLAGEGDARKARLVAGDLPDVPAEDAVDHRLAHDPVGAEPVDDRAVEAAELRELGVRVQRVLVAREAIEQRLLRQRARFEHPVGRALGRDVARLRPGLAAEAALAAQE